MPAPQRIKELVKKFEENFNLYQSSDFNEEALRTEFLNPFFEALGWDIEDKAGRGVYRDVHYEERIKRGAPDFGFYTDGKLRFYVEAKNPSLDVCNHARSALQLRGYGWSAKVPRSILTDFEELSIYDTTIRPKAADRARVAKLDCIRYTEFVERWDEIADTFSRQAVLAGSLEKFEKKHAKQAVDDELLEDISKWREILAKNIANRNDFLHNEERLNRIVQDTIARLLFLRICEDRDIAHPGTLQAVTEGEDTFKKLHKLFKKAEQRYDSDLFEVNSIADLVIDDKVLKEIISELYFPKSPYKFDAIPAEILGQVYEQFLGKVIRLTEGGHAKIEEKPAVRKAGGIYYTPTYIVEYIVRNTVGKLVEGKTPKQIETLSIVDPACGSGSFLLGAYKFLVDWYRDWYVKDGVEKHQRVKKIYLDGDKQWQLTLDERKRILLAHIYGVDIDRQAVEMAKLSLMVEALRAPEQQSLFNDRMLPRLSDNVKCGNALIGTNYFMARPRLTPTEMAHINPFDWDVEFPEVFKKGGFDTVIGNPPYLNIDDTWGKSDARLKAIKSQYEEVYNDKTDLLFYFLVKAWRITRNNVNFIVSRAFLEAFKADRLRGFLASNTRIQEIIDFQNHIIFQGVGITTCIIKFSKEKERGSIDVYKLNATEPTLVQLERAKHDPRIFTHLQIEQGNLSDSSWIFVDEKGRRLNKKIDAAGQPLGEVVMVGQGMQTGCNDVFGGRTQKEIKSWGLKAGTYFLRASNSDIGRFMIRNRAEYLLYLEDFESFDALPKGVQKFLTEHAAELKERAAYKRGNCEWWKFTWPLHKENYSKPRILCPYLASYNRFALDVNREYIGLTDTTVLFPKDHPESLNYFLALLNSRLLTFRFKSIGKLKSGGVFEYFWNSISKIPIHRINFKNTAERKSHDELSKLAEKMSGLQAQLTKATDGSEQVSTRRLIAGADRQIDQLVYKLYGLTEEEIRVVEVDTK